MESPFDYSTEITVQRFLDSRPSQNTRRAYANVLRTFGAVQDLLRCSRTDVEQYARDLRQAGASAPTINLHISALSSFYHWAERSEILQGNPADITRSKINPYGKGTFLDAEQARALIEAIDIGKEQGKRDYALILGYLLLGLRNTAWRTARWQDFGQVGGKVIFTWSSKGKTDEKSEVPPPLWEALLAIAPSNGKAQGYCFCARDSAGKSPLAMSEVGRIVKKYARKAGLEAGGLKVHSLRHTAAMLRYAANDDVLQISKFLRHSNVSVTQVYLDHLRVQNDTSWQTVAGFLGIGGKQ